MEERVCNVCGETWVDDGEFVCPFCGSDDTSPLNEDDEEWKV